MALTNLGCSHTVPLSELSPAEQARYRGTDPGWHTLSPYFAVEIKSNGVATFYHIRDPQDLNNKEAIGRQYVRWVGGEFLIIRKSGPRENAYAISKDGRGLLYFEEPIARFVGPGREVEPRKFGAKLHLYRHGLGDSLVVSDVDHWNAYPPQGDPSVPDGAVIYSMPDKQGHKLRTMWSLGPSVVRSIEEFMPR